MSKNFFYLMFGIVVLTYFSHPALASTSNQTVASSKEKFLRLSVQRQVQNSPEFIGPLSNVGQALADDGIHMNILMSDTFANSGGAGDTPYTTANLARIRPELDIDLKNLGLLQTHILAAFTFFGLRRNPYQYQSLVGVSSMGAVIGVHKPPYQLSELALQQDFYNNKVEFEVGQTNPSYDFDPNVCGPSPACAGAIAKYVGGMEPPDNGQLGAILRVILPSHFFFKAGAFDIRPSASFKTGVNLLMADSTGGEGDLQIGHRTSFENSYLPDSYELTGFYNTQKVINGISKQSEYGAGAVILTGTQTVWRSENTDGSLPMHHLDLWTKTGYSPNKNESFDKEFNVGANYYGILPERPFDSVGIRFSYYHITNSGLAIEEAERVKLGGSKVQTKANEFTYSVLTTFDLYRHATLTPDFMYVLNPDDFSGNSKRLPHDGWQFTVTLRVPLGSLLGLSS